MLAILHISDLHFGRHDDEIFKDKRALAQSIVNTIDAKVADATNKLLVVSGDLVWGGNPGAYPEANAFIKELCSLWKVNAENIVICPGNHDVAHDMPSDVFGPIDRLIFELTHNSDLMFKDQNCLYLPTAEADFVVINSAFHHNHTYGLADIRTLPKFRPSTKVKVAVIHHNLLGIRDDDTSTLRNAYLIKMCNQLHIDLEAEYVRKLRINEPRFRNFEA
ncbi:MAG: metallophosphoesterase family protein [Verrucomicrobiia bacterium]